jgi:hypothetical protein
MQVLGRADRLVGLVVLGEGEHDIARVAQDRYAQGRGSQRRCRAEPRRGDRQWSRDSASG